MPLTKIRQGDLHSAEVSSIISEIIAARASYSDLNAHIESITGGASHGSILTNAVNIAKTNFKLNAHLASKREMLSNLIIDVFEDQEGIDPNLSSNYVYDPVLKSFSAEYLNWTLQSSTPGIRGGCRATYDSNRGVVVLFGPDTWEYDGTAWTKITTANSPSPRLDVGLAYDSNRGVVVLFGGSASGATFNETWEYDGTDWTRIETPTTPPPRSHLGFAYDESRHVIVMQGGYMPGTSPDGLTWEYDGVNWVSKSLNPSPGGIRYHQMVYDSSRSCIVLFGGLFSNQTWEYDGSSWVLRSPLTSPPSREHMGMVFDSQLNVTVMYGGLQGSSGIKLNDAWIWDGNEWAEVTPNSNISFGRWGMGMTYDKVRSRFVVCGGYFGSVGSPSSTSEVWEGELSDRGILISTPDALETTPSTIYLVPDVRSKEDLDYLAFESSLDNGQTWFPISPEMLVDVPLSATPESTPTLRMKAIMQGKAKLSGWAYGWM